MHRQIYSKYTLLNPSATWQFKNSNPETVLFKLIVTITIWKTKTAHTPRSMASDERSTYVQITGTCKSEKNFIVSQHRRINKKLNSSRVHRARVNPASTELSCLKITIIYNRSTAFSNVICKPLIIKQTCKALRAKPKVLQGFASPWQLVDHACDTRHQYRI